LIAFKINFVKILVHTCSDISVKLKGFLKTKVLINY